MITKPFTVLLLYPREVACEYADSYLTCVEALTPDEAITTAQRECTESNGLDEDNPNFDPTTLTAMCVFRGCHPDIK